MSGGGAMLWGFVLLRSKAAHGRDLLLGSCSRSSPFTLPWFSLSMIAFDGIFVSSSSYRTLARWAAARVRSVRRALERRIPRLRAASATS